MREGGGGSRFGWVADEANCVAQQDGSYARGISSFFGGERFPPLLLAAVFLLDACTVYMDCWYTLHRVYGLAVCTIGGVGLGPGVAHLLICRSTERAAQLPWGLG